MVNPSNKNLRQSLMTNLTIPIFPLWQSLIRKLTILFFLISIPNIELTILTIKNDKFDEISATKNKILEDFARSCKIPRATADNIWQLKLTENWPITLWRIYELSSWLLFDIKAGKVEKGDNNNKQWQSLETARSTSSSKNIWIQ